MKEAEYAIKDLEILSGIKMHTIRIWEKRYQLLSPRRTKTNIRLYSDADLKRILNIAILVNNGYKISKIAQWSDAEISEKVIEASKTQSTNSSYIEQFLLYLIDFDLHKIDLLYQTIISAFNFEDACYKIFFPLFERVGTYWQTGTLFPAQEHLLSNYFRQKIISETDKLGINTQSDKSFLFFLRENEWHELSLLFYSYLAKKQGFQIIYLGQSVPFEDLIKIRKKINPDYIFTSFINPLPSQELENYLQELKQIFPTQKVFVNGLQVKNTTPHLPRNFKVIKHPKELKKYIGNTLNN